MSATAEIANGGSSGALAQAHAKLLKDKTLQFDFQTVPPPKESQPPAWLVWLGKALANLFEGLMPVLQLIFWVGVAAIVALILFLIVREVWGAKLGWQRKAKPARAKPADWRPDAMKARALLEDADRLADAGNYEAAVHLILYRSIEDIEGKRPRLVRPALTSRDIAALEAVPGAARSAFGLIADVVEASFFGGRVVDRDGFARCRQAYEAFAFPEVWA